MYVSYEFYTETFGTLIPEKDFPRVEAEAEAAISYLTYINGDIVAKEDNRETGADLQDRHKILVYPG